MFARWSDVDRMFTAMEILRKSKLDRLLTEMGRPYGPGQGWTLENSAPRTNLYDTGDKFLIQAEVPGLAHDDLSVKIQGNYLEIGGSRKDETPEGYTIHRAERGPVSFSRSLTLPSDVDADKAEATLKNGILTLTLPKAEAAKPKQVAIN